MFGVPSSKFSPKLKLKRQHRINFQESVWKYSIFLFLLTKGKYVRDFIQVPEERYGKVMFLIQEMISNIERRFRYPKLFDIEMLTTQGLHP